MAKRALITGITGQDGAYLAQLLLSKGYQVAGTYRPTSSLNLWRLQALGIAEHPDLRLLEHDLTDLAGSFGLLEQTRPDEVYNLAAQSFVGLSFKQPVATAQVTAIGPLNLLEAIRIVSPSSRFYQASSSEMFGGGGGVQNEDSPLHPRSPYASAKCFAHWATINYREAYGLYAVSGIMFNHESPLRSLGFVTRKITDGVARIRAGKANELVLGNLSAERDWGYAPEYVDGIWRMLQADQPEDYVLATGSTHSVRDFVTYGFAAADMQVEWRGHGAEEVGFSPHDGTVRVRVDSNLYRPADLERVHGDASRARTRLGWQAQTGAADLAALMVASDLAMQ